MPLIRKSNTQRSYFGSVLGESYYPTRRPSPHIRFMPKRSSKKREDLNETATRVVRVATGVAPGNAPRPEKNPAAVALGRLGGKKGGKARAAKLTAEERRAIAVKAAQSRWTKERPEREGPSD